MFRKKVKAALKENLKKYCPLLYLKIKRYRLNKRMENRFSRVDSKSIININYIGAWETTNNINYEEIKNEFTNGDFNIAYLKEYDKKAIENLENMGINAICISKANEKHNNDVLIKEKSSKVFNYKNVNIGVIHYPYENDYSKLFEEIKTLKTEAKYIIVYLSYSDFNDDVEQLINNLSKRVNQVIGINTNTSCPFDIPEKSKKALFSIGSFIKNQYNNENEKGSIIYKNVLKNYNNKLSVLERSYIPCYFDDKHKTIRRINYNENIEFNVYRNLCENISNTLDENRILTVEKIFKIINLDLPSKYDKYKSVVIDNICVLLYEIDKRCILFIRDYDSKVHVSTEKEYYQRIINDLKNKMYKDLVLVISPIDLPAGIPYIKVPNSLELHAKLCNHIINWCNFDIKVAVTGSTGKTSCKDMISLVLAEKYKTFKNTGSENLQIRMGLMLRELNPKYEAYVQEVGGGKIGGASNFSKMMEPDVGVITNIGYSHLRWSKTREQLAINKLGISDGIRNNGPLVINLDNDMLQKADIKYKNVITYAIDNKKADYYADNIDESDQKLKFDIVHKGKKVPCRLDIPGKYNIYNALTAFAIGQYFNIPDVDICRGISKFKPEGIRQTLINVGNYNLFVDCFNAAPNSMIEAVKTLSHMGTKKNKKIAVLGEITGMDEMSVELHKEVGKEISTAAIDYLICFGEDIKNTYETFSNPKTEKFFFEKKEDVVEQLRKIIEPGDFILFKGSSKYKLEQDILDEIWGTNLGTLAHSRKKKIAEKVNGVKYELYPKYAHVIEINDNVNIQIVPKVNAKKVISIASEACKDRHILKLVKLPISLRNIQNGAFKNCSELREVVFPRKLSIIEDNVFENCSKLEKVVFNDELYHIGNEAFKNCPALKEIKMTSKVSYIGENAFKGCQNLKIICPKNSYAAKYAKANKIAIEYIKE